MTILKLLNYYSSLTLLFYIFNLLELSWLTQFGQLSLPTCVVEFPTTNCAIHLTSFR